MPTLRHARLEIGTSQVRHAALAVVRFSEFQPVVTTHTVALFVLLLLRTIQGPEQVLGKSGSALLCATPSPWSAGSVHRNKGTVEAVA
jgi:hypothetical protein